MKRLNPKNSASSVGLTNTNYEGNVQDVKRVEQQLYEIVVMTLYGKDSFYESTDARVARLEQAVSEVVSKNNLDFVANSIIHARTEMKIRSMPIVLAVLFAKVLRDQKKQYPKLRQVVCDVIQRADQITDMYAFALSVFGSKKAVPMAIKRGVGDAFSKFNEYQFQKYNRGSAVKLADVLRIVHPKTATPTQGQLLEKIIKDELETPYTWETELTRNGSLPTAERKSPAVLWTELVDSGKLGYLALIRNMRNIAEAQVEPSVITAVANRVADPEQVAKSKMLPFQFVTAYDIVSGLNNTKLITAVSRAIEASLGNLPQLGKRVWIIVDCSQSMTMGRVQKAVPIRTAALFAAALAKANAEADNVRLTMFSDYAKDVPINTDEPIMTMTKNIMSHVFGGGTHLDQALAKKPNLGFEPDTVVLLSDMQVFSLSGGNIGPLFTDDCIKVAINLEAYETTPAGDRNGWLQLDGWSEKLFDFIPALRGGSSVVKKLSVPYVGVQNIRGLASMGGTDG